MSTRAEAVDIAVDNQRIEGTLIFPQTPYGTAPGVLFVHGWGGNQNHYLDEARALAATLGCVCLTFNLRGHAETGAQHDTVNREDNMRDVIAAYDVLAGRQGVERGCIALVGSSYGAYLGALLTYMRPVRLLALQAPALYKDDDWEVPKRKLHVNPDFAAYRRLSLRAEDNRALGACAQFFGDALVVESEHDEIIPHPAVANYIAAFANAHSLTYRVIQGADHALSREAWERAYTELLVNWLSEMIKEGTCLAPSSS
ncbi:MAG TPA: alpha/beta fold hydrolase [Burkholderiales bacterium]|nr:alpha/beta fold hydrolase [Burkholderiales bacterium]